MTGYGRGHAEGRVASAEVELRSVNGKGLSLKLRVPADRLALEPVLEGKLRARLTRGSVQGYLRIRLHEHPAAVMDKKVLRRYLKEWRQVEKGLGLEEQDPRMAELLALPGAYEEGTESSSVSRAVAKTAILALKEAVDSLQDFRANEGQRLRRELQSLLRKLSAVLKKVHRRAPKAVEAAQGRMQQRVQEAMASADVLESLDLTKEMVALADKADVREEIARLEIHFARLEEILLAGGPCGREIEFLVQECHREITTLGNKSGDSTMSAFVVSMKLLAGQLKEQVANVE